MIRNLLRSISKTKKKRGVNLKILYVVVKIIN